MSIERLKTMKEVFMCAVEGQMYNLAEVDAEELGEVVDMIKDLSEAIYYCEVAKAMEDSEKHKNENSMYYMEDNKSGEYDVHRMYYGDNKGHTSSNGYSSSESSNGNESSSHYSEKEFPNAFSDAREGRSPRSRRMYMETKETKQDKAAQMRELEKYMQELAYDITEMIEGSSPEERQYLSKKIAALSTKINQPSPN